MTFKEKVVYPILIAFGVTLATGIASSITDGRILNWTGILTASKPVITSAFRETNTLKGELRYFSCDDGKIAVSCFAGLYPSGDQFCGSRIIDRAGDQVCEVNECTDVDPPRYWGITLSCQ